MALIGRTHMPRVASTGKLLVQRLWVTLDSEIVALWVLHDRSAVGADEGTPAELSFATLPCQLWPSTFRASRLVAASGGRAWR